MLFRREDAKLLAGGHSLLPAMKLRISRPALLVDVGRLHDLRYIREDGDAIAIGALTRHADIEKSELLERECGLLAYTAGLIGDPQVRHRGTIGGTTAHGDPASDTPTVLLALDAEIVARGPDGERRIAAADFFRDVYETALGPQDVVTEVRVPRLNGAGWAYQKFVRRAQDWATVGVAAVVRDGGAAVALTNMGATPIRARGVEGGFASSGAEAAEAAAEGTEPTDEVNASAEFKRHLARVLTRRALEQALA